MTESAHASSPSPNLQGRRVVVTGATSGIGERTAYNLVRMGAEVIVVGRDRARVEVLAESLSRGGGHAVARVADLSDRRAVVGLAEGLRGEGGALDVLVNNAGALLYERRETAAGSEATFALNVEAPFLLTELLLPLLVRSGHGRVVNVASAAHQMGHIHFDDLDLHHGYSGWKAYNQSKLALVLLTRQAAKVHAGVPVTFNCCHPGFVRSRFGDEGSGARRRMLGIAKSLGGISVERGAITPTYLASAHGIERYSGEYFVGCQPRPPARRARQDEDAARLWAILLQRTALGAPTGNPVLPATGSPS